MSCREVARCKYATGSRIKNLLLGNKFPNSAPHSLFSLRFKLCIWCFSMRVSFPRSKTDSGGELKGVGEKKNGWWHFRK